MRSTIPQSEQDLIRASLERDNQGLEEGTNG